MQETDFTSLGEETITPKAEQDKIKRSTERSPVRSALEEPKKKADNPQAQPAISMKSFLSGLTGISEPIKSAFSNSMKASGYHTKVGWNAKFQEFKKSGSQT